MASPKPPLSPSSNSDNESPDGPPKCALCHNAAVSPRLLDCIHSACLGCIISGGDLSGNVIRCPICRTCTSIPQDGVTSLPCDYSVVSPKTPGSAACKLCCRGNNVVARCMDCKDASHFLCADCVVSHKEMAFFRHHRVVPLSPSNADSLIIDKKSCRRHAGELLVYFCKECSQPQCRVCSMNDPNHFQFRRSLDESISEWKASFSSGARFISNVALKLMDVKRGFESFEEHLKMQREQARRDIDLAYCAIVKAAEMKRNEEFQKVDEVFILKQFMVNKTLNEIKTHYVAMQELHEFVQRMLSNGSGVELLESVKVVTSRAESLVNYKPPFIDPLIGFTCSADLEGIHAIVNKTFGSVNQSIGEIMQNSDTNDLLEFTLNSQPTMFDTRQSSLTEQKSAFDMAINQMSIVPQTNHHNHHGLALCGLESRASNSPVNCGGGDIFSSADMFQGGEVSRLSRKTVDELAPPKSNIIRQKINIANKFGDFGQAQGLFSEPSGVAINPLNNNILIADTNNHRVEIFDSKGTFRFEINVCGKDDGQLLYPNRVTVCKLTGNIVITERSPTHQVHIYTQDGKFLRRFGGNILQHPRGVCVDGQGRVIVVECKIQRIVVFNQNDGSVLHKINCAPRLEFPVGVAANDKLGEIYVADNRGHSVKVFSYMGAYLRTIGGAGITNYPIGVGVCPGGQVIIADNHNNFNLTIFTNEGQLISAFEGRMKHQQCYDVAFSDDGTVVLTCKDFAAYIYHCSELAAMSPTSSFLSERFFM